GPSPPHEGSRRGLGQWRDRAERRQERSMPLADGLAEDRRGAGRAGDQRAFDAPYQGSDRSSRYRPQGARRRGETHGDNGWRQRRDDFGDGYAEAGFDNWPPGVPAEWDKRYPDVSRGVRWPGDAPGHGGSPRRFGATRPPSRKLGKRFFRTRRQRIIAAVCLGLFFLTPLSPTLAGAPWGGSP